jgi:hypothetical protein
MPNHYTTLMICSPGHDFNVADFNERHKESDLCSIVMPMPESVEQVRSVHYPDGTTEKERLGVDQDWHDWAQANWGTKWGTYDVEAFDLGGDGSPVLIKFQTAWRAPKVLDKIADWLKRTYAFEKVAFVGFNPSDDSVSMLGGDGTPHPTTRGER